MNNPTPTTWIPFAPQLEETPHNYNPEFTTINLSQIALTVCQAFENEAQNKKIKLLLEADKNIDLYIQGNHADVALMLTQMIKNALAQTLEGYVHMRLIQNRNEILVEVDDSGIGIHPNEKIAMVEVMYRGRLCRITHVQDPKTCMVLMANQLTSHQATIEICIDPGKGMKRRLALPILQQTEEEIQFAGSHELSLTG
ncbi:MAG: sensor histidine kinase [Anaerolineae bacterium]